MPGGSGELDDVAGNAHLRRRGLSNRPMPVPVDVSRLEQRCNGGAWIADEWPVTLRDRSKPTGDGPMFRRCWVTAMKVERVADPIEAVPQSEHDGRRNCDLLIDEAGWKVASDRAEKRVFIAREHEVSRKLQRGQQIVAAHLVKVFPKCSVRSEGENRRTTLGRQAWIATGSLALGSGAAFAIRGSVLVVVCQRQGCKRSIFHDVNPIPLRPHSNRDPSLSRPLQAVNRSHFRLTCQPRLRRGPEPVHGVPNHHTERHQAIRLAARDNVYCVIERPLAARPTAR